MTRPNTYTDDLYATRLLRDLEALGNPRPDLGGLILGLSCALWGLFWWWALA